MTDREAMKMALEALLADQYDMVVGNDGNMEYKTEKAIEALRQALAQPEQEPVAWLVKDVLDGLRYPSSLKNPKGSIKGESQPLYTAPPKREWVGLTDEEVASFENAGVWGEKDIRAIEAKLKEKNT